MQRFLLKNKNLVGSAPRKTTTSKKKDTHYDNNDENSLSSEPQKEGGWTITSPLVSELVTEIDELDDLNSCIQDALAAAIELYKDMGKQFPANLQADNAEAPVCFESLVMAEG